MRRAQIVGDLLCLHHRGAALRERGFLARLRRQAAELFNGMAQPLGLAAGALNIGAMALHRRFALAPLRPQRGDRGGLPFDAAIGVEQSAMRGRFDEGALIVLTVDFDERYAKRAQDLHTDRLIVDKGAGAAVGKLHPAQNELVFAAQAIVGKERARRMVLADFKSGNHLTLHGAVAHQGDVAARSERKSKSVEQDGFAGAGFAGQYGKTGAEIDVQPIDKDDVADGEPGEHSEVRCRRSDIRAQMILAILFSVL